MLTYPGALFYGLNLILGIIMMFGFTVYFYGPSRGLDHRVISAGFRMGMGCFIMLLVSLYVYVQIHL